MGRFKKETRESDHARKFRRKLARLGHRDLLDLTEGHVGQVAVAVLAMRQGPSEGYQTALWEALRLTEELTVMLSELETLA